jgi:hypothetical protein
VDPIFVTIMSLSSLAAVVNVNNGSLVVIVVKHLPDGCRLRRLLVHGAQIDGSGRRCCGVHY